MRRISFHSGRQLNSQSVIVTNCQSNWGVAKSLLITGTMNLKKTWPMHVVSDTSPLSCLASIQRLDLLEIQFSSVCVPPAVRMEMLRHPVPQARDLLEQAVEKGWIVEDASTALLPLALLLNRTLDEGEPQAISLAANRRADLLLVDEREGRKAARGLGLRVTGTLGILMPVYRLVPRSLESEGGSFSEGGGAWGLGQGAWRSGVG